MSARERQRWRDGFLPPALAGALVALGWNWLVDATHMREPLTTIIPVLVLVVGVSIGYVRRRRERARSPRE